MVTWVQRTSDIRVNCEYGLCWVWPETDRGKAWVNRNLPANWEPHVQHHPEEGYYELEQWFCDQIVDRMKADGLKLLFTEPIDWEKELLGEE